MITQISIKLGRRRFFGKFNFLNNACRTWIHNIIPFPEHIGLKVNNIWYEVYQSDDKSLSVTNEVRRNGIDADFDEIIDLGHIGIDFRALYIDVENVDIDHLMNDIVDEWLIQNPKYHPFGTNCQTRALQ